jgi:hypothetical protein
MEQIKSPKSLTKLIVYLTDASLDFFLYNCTNFIFQFIKLNMYLT